MQKTSQPAQRNKWIVIGPLFLVGVIGLLAVLYGVGAMALPRMIAGGYANQNCDTVVQLEHIYASTYAPLARLNTSLSTEASECSQYSVAQAAEKNHDWQGAYISFKAYTDQYPNGLLARDAREQTALSLTSWAKELAAQKDFADAIAKLSDVTQNYNDTASASAAQPLINQTYLTWTQAQRSAKDFTGAEATFKQWQGWAQNNGDNGSLKQAQTQLAQMYLDWGLDLQNQKDFTAAEDKLNEASASDPTGQIAPQANTLILSLETNLGDALIASGSFEQAIAHYNKAVTLSDANHQPAAKDTVAKGYLAWADSLTKTGDFLGALERIKDAESNLGTEAFKSTVEADRKATYQAFSNSSGDQATTVINAQAKAVCEEGPKSELPIIGIDSTQVHAVSYGDIDPLPSKVNAATPGALHYVVCVKLEKVILERMQYFEYLARTQLIWDVTLRDAVFGTIVKQQRFLGPTPQPFLSPANPNWQEAGLYIAGPPSMDTLVAWLLTVMK